MDTVATMKYHLSHWTYKSHCLFIKAKLVQQIAFSNGCLTGPH